MQVVNEHYNKEAWAASLRALEVKTQCIVADAHNYATLRTTATRLQQKLGTKYSFKKLGKIVKVWRVE